ncbi:MAG: 5'-methylthioadenosine/adenosylhomocysteine nucleosidase [Rikenellaceae bacterium]
MNRIGVIVAMSKELQLVTSQMNSCQHYNIAGVEFITGRLAKRNVVVAQSGIGKVCSAVCAVEMISKFSPTCIINCGVAGGLDSSLKVMDVVVGRESLYNDTWCGDGNKWGQVQGLPARFRSDDNLYNIALSANIQNVTIHGGVVCSGDKFITSRSELDAIKAQIPEVLSTDMESNSIAQVCHIYSIPFVSVRIISDTPGADDHAEQYDNFWDEVPKTSFEVLKQVIEKI